MAQGYLSLLERLNTQFHLQVMADVVDSDLAVNVELTKNAKKEEIVTLLEAAYGKTLYEIDGTSLFRGSVWPQHLGKGVPKLNRMEIKLGEVPQPNLYRLPPQTFQLAGCAPAGVILRELSQRSQQTLTFPDELAIRPLAVFLTGTTTARVMHGVGFLLNSTPAISLRKSVAQKEMEEDSKVNLPKDLAIQARKSAALKQDLLALLSPQQRSDLVAGMPVELSFLNLPDRLRGPVSDYLSFSADLVGMNLDTSRRDAMGVRLLPPSQSPFGILGGIGRDKNGNICYF